MKAKVYSKPVATPGSTQKQEGLPAVTPFWTANVFVNANAVVNANVSANVNWT